MSRRLNCPAHAFPEMRPQSSLADGWGSSASETGARRAIWQSWIADGAVLYRQPRSRRRFVKLRRSTRLFGPVDVDRIREDPRPGLAGEREPSLDAIDSWPVGAEFDFAADIGLDDLAVADDF